MKLFLLTLITLFITFFASSQPAWNIFAGPQATSSHYTIGGVRQDNTAKIGFQAGIGCKVPFDNQLSFSPVAFYSLKGYKVTLNRYSFPPDSSAIDNNTTIHT